MTFECRANKSIAIDVALQRAMKRRWRLLSSFIRVSANQIKNFRGSNKQRVFLMKSLPAFIVRKPQAVLRMMPDSPHAIIERQTTQRIVSLCIDQQIDTQRQSRYACFRIEPKETMTGTGLSCKTTYLLVEPSGRDRQRSIRILSLSRGT